MSPGSKLIVVYAEKWDKHLRFNSFDNESTNINQKVTVNFNTRLNI